MNAYEIVLEADSALDQNKDAQITEDLYFSALKRYIAIEKVEPDFLTSVIQYRIAYCNEKVISLRKKRGVEIKLEPKDEIQNEIQGKLSFEKIEELLNIRNTELAELKAALDDVTKKLEQEMLNNAEAKEKYAEIDKKVKEKDKKWQEDSTEGYISVKELNDMILPLRKKIEELKEAYKNAKTDEEKAKVIEQYVKFVQSLNNQLKFEELHLAGMGIETIIIDVRDDKNPKIYRNNGQKGEDPLVPVIKDDKKK